MGLRRPGRVAGGATRLWSLLLALPVATTPSIAAALEGDGVRAEAPPPPAAPGIGGFLSPALNTPPPLTLAPAWTAPPPETQATTPPAAAIGTTTARPTKTRKIERANKVTVFCVFALGMFVMVAMYIFQERVTSMAEEVKAGMASTMGTDRYIVKILRNFSVKTVEEHIFHGILPRKDKVSIQFENLCTTIRASPHSLPCLGVAEEKRILMGVSGKFESGHVAAIMGTSGAGKTTFLNVLCGKIGAMGNWDVTGTVFINGKAAELAALKNVMGFVPQDDVVHERMTVRENIHYSAGLRNPAGTSTKRLKRITEDVLQVLQLEVQQNLLVGNRTTGGGLSGGQRKRVNVGLELAACPTLLFLDEPTSGLDATGSLMLVKQLQKMTQLGMTIVMVVHQPRYGLFTLIDDVLLLGKGGRTVFIGPTAEAKPYFESLGFTIPPNENPADWMMDVMSAQAERDNPKIPREDLPEKLFQEWELRGPIFAEAMSDGDRRLFRRNTSSAAEVQDIIKSHLKDAWGRVDPPRTTALDAVDFAKVLKNCTGVVPDEHVTQQIMKRISYGRARQIIRCPLHRDQSADENKVHHMEFEQYLLAVHRGPDALRHFTGSTTSFAEDELYEEEEEDDTIEEDGDSSEEESATSDAGSPGESEDTHLATVRTRRSARDAAVTRCRTDSSKHRPRRDLERTLPGYWAQTRIILSRGAIKWWRRQPMRVMFLVVIEFAALFLGVMDRWVFKTPAWMPETYLNAMISLALLTSVYSLQTFGSSEELPMYWREVSHGLNRASNFMARAWLDALDMFLMCFGFTASYYIVCAPELGFATYVLPFCGIGWVARGWGYTISCWLPYGLISLGPFVSALLSFVMGGILGLPNHMDTYLSYWFYEAIVSISFTRWAVPMLFFQYIKYHEPAKEGMNIIESHEYDFYVSNYRLGSKLPGDHDYFWTSCLALFLIGLFLHALAFVGLMVMNKSKQI